MAMTASEVQILLSARDDASDIVKKLEMSVTSLSSTTEKAQGLFGSILQGFAVGAGIAGFQSLQSSIESTIGSAAKFQAEMVNIQNNTGMTAKQTEIMSANILQMSDSFGVATDKIAEGFKHVQNITQDAAASQVIMNSALESAASTGADVGAVANVLAGTMHEYGLDVVKAADGTNDLAKVQENANHAMGVMHLAAQMSNVDLGQWTAALSTSIGIASGMHQPLEDIGAMFAALSKHGFPDAAAAGTQIQDLFAHLIHLTPQATDALKQLAMTSGVDLVSSLKGLNEGSVTVVDFLGQMRQAMFNSGLTTEEFRQEIFKIIPAMRGGFGAAALLTTGFDDMNTTLAALNDQEKVNQVTEQGWQATLGTAQKQWEILTNTLHNFGITAGTELMPAIAPFLKAINDQLPAALQMASAGLAGLGDAIRPLSTLMMAMGDIFSSVLGNVLMVVTTIGQAIYEGLQWLNPFAAHSAPLVSQVQDGVAAIETAYSSLGGITTTFDGLGVAFESLAGKSAAFAATVDDVSIKTEKALSVMGPGVTDAFNTASAAMETAKVSLADIKSAWDGATDALIPLKDNLDAAKEGLKDQESALAGLKLQLTDAKAAFDPLNEALKDATQAAKDADTAIKGLTNAPIQGEAAFTQKISDANIALKQQALALSDIKQSTAYMSLTNQIDAAAAKLKEMQRAQSAQPTVVAGQSASQRAATAEASNAARAALADQQAALDILKGKQADLLAPGQKKLDQDRNILDTINLQRDATIGVQQEQIKQAAATAQGIKERSQAEITAAIVAAGAAKSAASSQVDTLTPQVAAQQAAMDGLTAKILDQDHAVAAAKVTADAANTTYTDAKAHVDDLGKAYRDTKAEIAAYDQQLKATIQTGDTQVQKIAAAAAAAKAAAKAAASGGSLLGGPPVTAPLASAVTSVSDAAAGVSGAVATVAKPFSDLAGPVKAFVDRIMGAGSALSTFLAPLSGLGRWLSGLTVAFLAFNLAVGPVWGLLSRILAPVIQLAPKLVLLLSPVGLLVVGLTALGAAIATNFGGIRDKLQPVIDIMSGIVAAWSGDVSALATITGGLRTIFGDAAANAIDPLLQQFMILGPTTKAAFDSLGPILENLRLVFDKVFKGDIKGALDTFVAIIGAVGSAIGPIIRAWADVFVNWITPLLPRISAGLGDLVKNILTWITGRATDIATALVGWGAALSGWVQANTQPMLDSLGTLKDRLLTWIGGQTADLGTKLSEWGAKFGGWAAENVQPMLDSLGGLKDRLLGWIAAQVKPIGDQLQDWGSQLSVWADANVQPMLDSLGVLKDKLVGWIGDQANAIGKKVSEWGAAFSGWAGDHIQPMLDDLGGLKDGLLGWIGDRVKDLSTAAGAWAGAFVDWTKDIWPSLSGKLASLKTGIGNEIGTIKATIATKFGEIDWSGVWDKAAGIGTGFEVALSLIDWGKAGEDLGAGLGATIRIALDTLDLTVDIGGKVLKIVGDALSKIDWSAAGTAVAPKALQFILGIVEALMDLGMWARLIQEHWQLVLSVVIGIIFAPSKFIRPIAAALSKVPLAGPILEWIALALTKMGDRIVAFFGGQFGFAAGGLADAFLGGLSRTLTSAATENVFFKAISGIPKVIGSFRDDVLQAGFLLAERLGVGLGNWITGGLSIVRKVGADVVGGLVEGLTSQAVAIEIGIIALVAGLVETAKKHLGIASPSTVFAEIGADVIGGLLLGFTQKWADIEKWLTDTFGTGGTFTSAIPDAGKLLTGIGMDILMGLKDGLDAGWTAGTGVYAWLTALPIQISDTLNAMKPLETLLGVGSDLLAGLKNGLDAGWAAAGGVWEWLNGLLGIILTTLENLKPGEGLFSVGTELMKGFLDGAKSGWADLQTWFSNLTIPTLPSISTSPLSRPSTNRGSDSLTDPQGTAGSDPLRNVGNNIAKGAPPISDAQFSAAVRAMGFTQAEIESICGPIAAEGMAQALTNAVVNLPKLVHGSEGAGLGNFSGDVGTFGNSGEIGILKQAGVDAKTVSMTEAEALAAQGIPVIINTAHHFWLAQGYDTTTGRWDIGATNVYPTATGGGRELLLKQISDAAGAVQGFIVGATTATAAADLEVLKNGINDIPKGGESDQFNKLILDAQQFATQFGISIDAANNILLDHGAVAKAVLGTDVPGAFVLTDAAVEGFADKFGVSWNQARDILTTGGDVATAVLGTQIPDAVQATVDAVSTAGNPALWNLIRGNAVETGRDLATYLKDIGAPAIDKATASLNDLVSASGLSLPQVQEQAAAAGKDIRAWLLTVGVPAADALRDSLAGPAGLAQSAIDLKKPVDDANTAAASLAKDGLDVATTAVDALGGKQGEVAKNISTQIAAVLLLLRDGLLGEGDYKGRGLIKAVRDFISALADIHNVDVTITTHYRSDGTPSAAGSASGSSGSVGDGSSGPGGSRNNPSTGQPYTSTPSNTGGGGQVINTSTPGAGRTNPYQFALGGHMYPDRLSLVGERGPELILPSMAGFVHHAGATAAITSAMGKWPTPQTIAQTSTVLKQMQAAQIAQSRPTGSGAISGYIPRSAPSAPTSGGVNIDQLASKIGVAVAKELRNNPPHVAVDEIRSLLINVGSRNGGQVGLA